jgi:hypothetical protein
MLDQYLNSFNRLRTYKNRKRWFALTTYQAPHKPFLLMSVIDLIAQGSIIENYIELSFPYVAFQRILNMPLAGVCLRHGGELYSIQLYG